MKRTGAQIIWEVLVREGVDVVFGYPGGAILPAYDAMLGYPIRHVLVRHEQGATHMADGYARASGKVGVCVATSGPGATNLVTGIATAMLDSVADRLHHRAGARPSCIGTDAFQETDITGVTLPITKHNYLVTDVRGHRARRSARRSTSRAPAARARARRHHQGRPAGDRSISRPRGDGPAARLPRPSTPSGRSIEQRGRAHRRAPSARSSSPVRASSGPTRRDELLAFAEKTGDPRRARRCSASAASRRRTRSTSA